MSATDPGSDAGPGSTSGPGSEPGSEPGSGAQGAPGQPSILVGPRRPFPVELVHDLFLRSCARHPEAIAASDPAGTLSYGELELASLRLAEKLARLGVRGGAPVGVALAPSNQVAVALVGILRAGGACLPLDLRYPQQRLAFMLADSGCEVVVSAGGESPTVPGADHPVVLDIAEAQRPAAPAGERSPGVEGPPGTTERQEAMLAQARPHDPAYVIYTSGSTGAPKGVVLSHQGLANHHQAVVERYGLSRLDRTLALSSLGFDISIEEMFPTWAAGGTVLYRDADAPLGGTAFLDDLERLGVTVLDLPTAFWHQWVGDLERLGKAPPRTLRALVVGGEAPHAAVLETWWRLAGPQVRWFNTYGPTEASVVTTCWELDHTLGVPPEVPMGTPIDNVEVAIVGEDGTVVPRGERGELCIAGAGVALGYLGRPELTAARFVPGSADGGVARRLYRSGDEAVLDQEGTLRFRGRSDDQVKISGFRVEPGEVAALLATHEDVAEAFVVARPGESGTRLVAYLVGKAGREPEEIDVVRYAAQHLPVHEVPSSCVVVDALPLNANGKVEREALPAPARVERRATGPARPASSASERDLVRLWSDLLGVAEVGVDDDFFELGGHSLVAIRMLAEVEARHGARVPMRALFESPTIARIAQIVDRLEGGAAGAPGGEGHAALEVLRHEGSAPPLIYLCTGAPGVLALRHVAAAVGPLQPVGAVMLARMARVRRPESIGDLAEAVLAELARQWPAPAYVLAGYSIGGLVAHEMAVRLSRRNVDVPLLAMLDTWCTGPLLATALLRRSLGELRGSGRPALRAGAAGMARIVARSARRHWRATGTGSPSRRGRSPTGASRGAAPAEDDELGELLSDLYDSYHPAPWKGPVVLVRTRATANWWQDDLLRWGSSVRCRPLGGPPSGWRVVEVPGEHGTIMRLPAVREVADALADAIGDVLGQSPRLARCGR